MVFGAGGHGGVVADCAHAAGLRVLGFVDDHVPAGLQIGDLTVLGPAAWLVERREIGVLLGVGDNLARQQIQTSLEQAGLSVCTLVHPRAFVSERAVLGAGTVVLALAAVNVSARIGRGVIVNTAAVVEHDCVLADFAHASPSSALGGAARLGERAQLGLAACVLPGRSVGAGSVVGAGAVVTRDIAPGAVVVGAPARPLRAQAGP